MCLPLLQLAWAVWDLKKKCYEHLWSNAYAVHKRMAAKRTILKNGCAMHAKRLFVFVKFFFRRCPSCISSQMLSELPQNPSPSLPANRSWLTCHDFHSETLKRQELQPLTLTSPGTSELIEISLFALWSLKKLIVSVNSFCCLQSLWLFVRDSWSPRKKQTEVK